MTHERRVKGLEGKLPDKTPKILVVIPDDKGELKDARTGEPVEITPGSKVVGLAVRIDEL